MTFDARAILPDDVRSPVELEIRWLSSIENRRTSEKIHASDRYAELETLKRFSAYSPKKLEWKWYDFPE